jgi:NTE family protein
LHMRTIFLQNYRAYTYGGIGAKAVFELYKQLEISFSGYYYVPYQKIMSATENEAVSFSKPFSYHYIAGSAQLAYHTAFGPIGLAVNYFEKPGDKVTILFNIGYLIFNRSRFYR